MTLWDGLARGFVVALTPLHIGCALAGALLGTAVGVLPGIGPAMTVALLLPLTYAMEPAAGMILLAGIYYGAMYGGSTTSIVFNVPGESATIVTAMEGHKMTRHGRAGAALATAAVGSFVAGSVGTLMIAIAGPWVATAALALGPAEQFALIVVAFTTVTVALGERLTAGLASLTLGLLLGLVGIDPLTGSARLTGGIPQLLDGIDVVTIAVAFLALGEALHSVVAGDAATAPGPRAWRLGMSRSEWRRSWPAWLRGTAIGFPLGAIPAGGAELPTLLSYGLERRLSPYPGEWKADGDGAIEGVAGPEAANNASAAGTLVPLLALGIPTTATAGVLIAALQQYGLQPGPLFFRQSPDLVWGLLASLLIANAMLLILNLPFVGMWAKLANIRVPWLHGGVVVSAMVGAWMAHRSATDVFVLTGLGVLALFWRTLGFPVLPVIVGAILGPLAEQQWGRALTVADGDMGRVIARPGAALLLGAAAAIGLVSIVWRRRKARTS